ncbi:MAG: hypothetical protein U1F57_05675 [bacterium]
MPDFTVVLDGIKDWLFGDPSPVSQEVLEEAAAPLLKPLDLFQSVAEAGRDVFDSVSRRTSLSFWGDSGDAVEVLRQKGKDSLVASLDDPGVVGALSFFLTAPYTPFMMLADTVSQVPFDDLRKLDPLGIIEGLTQLGVEIASSPPRPKKTYPEGTKIFTEDDLNDIAKEKMGDNPPVKKMKIRLDDGLVKITGKVSMGLFDADLEIKIRIKVEDGKATGSVEKLTADGITVPQWLVKKLIGSARSQEFSIPDDADLKDLSWLEIPNVKSLEIVGDRVFVQRTDAS